MSAVFFDGMQIKVDTGTAPEVSTLRDASFTAILVAQRDDGIDD
jgi:hypothetical protein